VGLSPDGSYVITTCDETIKGTRLDDGGNVFRLVDDVQERVTSWAIRPPTGLNLVSTGSQGRMLLTWDLVSGTVIRRVRGHDQQPILAMEFDRQGRWLATGAADGTVRVWDADGGFCTHHFKAHRTVVTALRFHPDADRAIVFSSSDDGTISVCDLRDKTCRATLDGHTSSVRSLDVSPCGRWLISAARDKTLQVWDWEAKTLKKLLAVMEPLEAACVMSRDDARRPDNATAVVSTRRRSKSKGSTTTTKTADGGSDDLLAGLWTAVAGEKGSIRVFDLATSECVLTQSAQGTSVTDMM
jgi:U3 small nucleolar RNA-associated protein 13